MTPNEFKVLMISRDRSILLPGSASALRMKEYGDLVSEIHIVVLSTKAHGLKDVQLSANVWVYPTNSFSRWFYVRSASKLGKKLVLAKKFVRGESLITTQDPFECGLSGLKIKNRWRIPLEVQIHTDPFSPLFKGFLNTLRKRIANKVIKKADSIRVVSEFLKNKIADHYHVEKNKINVLPIFIDREKIENAPVTFDLHARFGWSFIMLAVSRLTEEKNIPFLLQGLKLLASRYPSIGLVIVGSGSEEENLKKLSAKLGLEKRVAWVGWQEELGSYYKTANVFVQSSLFEGYGMSLVEAGLSLLPVVTTPVGIATDLTDGKDLYVYPQGNTDYFANVVADLVDNNQKRENLRLSMKKSLDAILISKEDFLKKMKGSWEELSKEVK